MGYYLPGWEYVYKQIHLPRLCLDPLLGATTGILLYLCKSIFHIFKTVILDNGFYVLRSLVELRKRGVFTHAHHNQSPNIISSSYMWYVTHTNLYVLLLISGNPRIWSMLCFVLYRRRKNATAMLDWYQSEYHGQSSCSPLLT